MIRLDLLELYGREYVIEHCTSVYLKRREDRLYKVYITDVLKAIAENTTHYQGAEEMFDYGSSISMRWIDVIEPQEEVKETDDRSCTDIVDDIWERIRNGR